MAGHRLPLKLDDNDAAAKAATRRIAAAGGALSPVAPRPTAFQATPPSGQANAVGRDRP